MTYPGIPRRRFLCTAALAAGGWALTGATSRPPNIVFILADDLGYSELGCYGNSFNSTPCLDRLAGEGVRFTDHYAAAPVCSPYRAALMTGQYPARVGINDYLLPWSDKQIPSSLVTLPEMLKQRGYVTGLVGKWHLTGYRNEKGFPRHHGFDEVMVSETKSIGNGDYFYPYRFNPEVEKRLPGREYLVDRCNHEAVEFIKRHRNRPFFLLLSHYAVHTVLRGKEEPVKKYKKKPAAGEDSGAGNNNPHLAAQLETIDQGAGMIAETLRKLGLEENTVVVFTSDNGGEELVTSNAPLRAGKSTLYEGGIRVPLIIRYPGPAPAGKVCASPSINMDFYPFFAGLSGASPGRKHDGKDLMPYLSDPSKEASDRGLFWHYPLSRPHFLGGRSSGAVRHGKWKLIRFYDTGELELYDLENDMGETENLASEMPARARELAQKLANFRERTGAQIPENCRDYNPDKYVLDPLWRRFLQEVVY
ncbi:MAG: sulfatase [bacterium]